jgi:hypothetical protein
MRRCYYNWIIRIWRGWEYSRSNGRKADCVLLHRIFGATRTTGIVTLMYNVNCCWRERPGRLFRYWILPTSSRRKRAQTFQKSQFPYSGGQEEEARLRLPTGHQMMTGSFLRTIQYYTIQVTIVLYSVVCNSISHSAGFRAVGSAHAHISTLPSPGFLVALFLDCSNRLCP